MSPNALPRMDFSAGDAIFPPGTYSSNAVNMVSRPMPFRVLSVSLSVSVIAMHTVLYPSGRVAAFAARGAAKLMVMIAASAAIPILAFLETLLAFVLFIFFIIRTCLSFFLCIDLVFLCFWVVSLFLMSLYQTELCKFFARIRLF